MGIETSQENQFVYIQSLLWSFAYTIQLVQRGGVLLSYLLMVFGRSRINRICYSGMWLCPSWAAMQLFLLFVKDGNAEAWLPRHWDVVFYCLDVMGCGVCLLESTRGKLLQLNVQACKGWTWCKGQDASSQLCCGFRLASPHDWRRLCCPIHCIKLT